MSEQNDIKIHKRYDNNKKKMLISFLLTLSYWIIKRKKQNKKILFLGLSGGQGSGKTTITAILKINKINVKF